jgi:hypothetical protein
MLRETPPQTMKPSPADGKTVPDQQSRRDGRDEGGDPACWAHLFEEAAETDGSADQGLSSKSKIT